MTSSTAHPIPGNSAKAALVSGASFAGLATGYWLNRLGYRVTIIEAASDLRRGGTPVDIEGETVEVLTRMGLAEAVRAKALPPRRFEFKDVNDVTLGSIGPGGERTSGERYEIHRNDLLAILFDAVAGKLEMVFERSIAGLEERANGIAVTLNDGSRREFELVFGCDGNRSNTRKLLFGEDKQFTYFMGGYIFLKVVSQTGMLPENVSQLFSVPGRMAMLNGYDDRTDIGFGFRTEGEIEYNYRDKEEQVRLINDRFNGLGWKVPAMLAAVQSSDEIYFDQINQIRMPRWSRGRVVLVGDAGYCLSPMAGFGGSMAIIGAGRLAAALEQHPWDYTAAFDNYEEGLRPFVEEVQERAALDGMSMICPADEDEFAERDRKIVAGDIGF